MTTATPVSVGKKTAAAWGNAVKADLDDLYATTQDTTIGTAAAGWTTQSGTVARTALGGKLIYVVLVVQRAAALTVTAGNPNPGDETMFTLDAAYRPTEQLNAVVGTGTETGEATINSAGLVVLRSLSDSAAAAANYRVSFTCLTN